MDWTDLKLKMGQAFIWRAGKNSAEDALEFLMAGATMVAVGTANFFNPYATSEIIDGLSRYVESEKLGNISEIIGCVG